MSKKKNSGAGLMSSAGLVNNYDSSKDAIQVQPKTVIIIGSAIGIICFAASHLMVI